MDLVHVLKCSVVARELLHGVFGVSETWQVSKLQLSAMLDDCRRDEVCAVVTETSDDVRYDTFTECFQDEHGERDALKQGVTPAVVCDLAPMCLAVRTHTWTQVREGQAYHIALGLALQSILPA